MKFISKVFADPTFFERVHRGYTVWVVNEANPADEAVPKPEPGLIYSKFESGLRFDQMERCYGMAMAEFQKLGYGWVIDATQINFPRPLVLGDRMTVRCWIEKFSLIGLRL